MIIRTPSYPNRFDTGKTVSLYAAVTLVILFVLLVSGCSASQSSAHNPFKFNTNEDVNIMQECKGRIKGIVLTADILVLDDVGTVGEKVNLSLNKEFGKIVIDTVAHVLKQRGYDVMRSLQASVGYSAPKRLFLVNENSQAKTMMPPFFVSESLRNDSLVSHALAQYAEAVAQSKSSPRSSELDSNIIALAFCSLVGTHITEKARDRKEEPGRKEYDAHSVELFFLLLDAHSGNTLYKVVGKMVRFPSAMEAEEVGSLALALVNKIPQRE